MISNRANLNNPHQKSSYLIFAIFLFILSLIGIFFLGRLNKSDTINTNIIDTITPTIIQPSPLPEATATLSPSASPSITIKLTPTIKPTNTPKPTIKPTPTIDLSSTPTPTPTFLTLTSNSNKFTVPYRSYRQLYQDKELSGDRYTLYSSQGNLAIHIGTGWSWSNSSRQFSDTLKVSSQNTFVYEIENQKIVDFEYSSLKYTIQCVHNGVQSLKDECNRFLSDFKLL